MDVLKASQCWLFCRAEPCDGRDGSVCVKLVTSQGATGGELVRWRGSCKVGEITLGQLQRSDTVSSYPVDS